MVRSKNFDVVIALLQAECCIYYQSLCTACSTIRNRMESQYGLGGLSKWPDTRRANAKRCSGWAAGRLRTNAQVWVNEANTGRLGHVLP